MKSTDFMRSVFCMCYSKNSIYENWRKNPLIHKNPFVYCRPAIRILQPYHSHIATLPFAYCRSTIRILFHSLFKLVKTASEGALSGVCFTRFIP